MIINKTNSDVLQITTRLLVEEALRKGYAVEWSLGTPSAKSGIIRCEKNGQELFFKSLNTSLTPSYGVFAAEDKYLTYSLLSDRGLPMPRTVVIAPDQSTEEAETLLSDVGEVVVKPVAANHGSGISVGVRTKEELQKAMVRARHAESRQPDIIVQEMVYGKEYRFLVLNDKVIAVAHRTPPSVMGDGIRSISELIDEKNADPRRGKGHTAALTLIDKQVVCEVFGVDFLQIVPKKGEEVQVLKTSNLSQGGESVDYTDSASKEAKQLAIDAAHASHLGIAGVDIMTTDIENATPENSWIIEVNVSPGIRMHQSPSQGKPRDVARKLFKAIEATARPIGKKLIHIGRVEKVGLPQLVDDKFKARVDTGATVSSVWASDIRVSGAGLHFKLFGPGYIGYTGTEHVISEYSIRSVRSSNGHEEDRYQVVMPVVIKGKRVKAKVTLADRSAQLYPMLIGRNIIRGKFIVDVLKGRPDKKRELMRVAEATSGELL